MKTFLSFKSLIMTKDFSRHPFLLFGINLLLSVILLATGSLSAFATATSSGYNAPILKTSLNFSARLENGKVYTSWTPYAPSGFNYYKVIRSTTNPDPVYPDDGYIKADGNPDASSYVDGSPKSGIAYYRVCSIVSPNRYCSNVVTINNGGDSYFDSSMDPIGINLKGELKDGYIFLSWTTDGAAPKGFKIAKSWTHQNPTYPIMAGDAYQYLTDPGARSLKDYDLKPGEPHYYRVCKYDGNGTCISYSNNISIIVSGDAAVTEGEVDTNGIEPATIQAKANLENGYIRLTWTIEGESPNGFKIAKSTTHQNPTYPVMNGDTYKYLTESYAREMNDENVAASKTYYYRVCQYNGSGGCITYSNSVSVTTPNDFKGADEEINKETGSSSEITPATLSLTGSVEEGYAQLSWTVDGETPKGIKIAISTTHESPTYPVMEGDSYKYLTSSDVRSYRDFSVKAGKTYHYRVCQYDGAGTCVSYSNAVTVNIPADFTNLKEEAYEDAVYYDKKGVNDVSAHRYKTAVQYLLNKNIAQGYNDGTFKPDNTINRAEFMKIVVGAKYSADYISVSARRNCFSDVRTDWYAPYVCIAKDEGVVGGYSDGTFKPSRNISFVEAAKILAEVYGLEVTKGSNWYTGYVKALQEENYIPSTVSTLEKPITRAEMAELIWRIKEQKKDQASSMLIQGDVVMESGAYTGWKKYTGNGFSFYHPNWYQGVKWGWDILTEELDFYQNLNTPNYMDVDTYLNVYTVAGSNLNTTVWFDHPLVSSQEMTINGVKVLKRHFRAPRGTVVNGRTTGENENITIYTYQLSGKVAVLHYFNAHGTENKDVDVFYKITESFQVE